MWSRENPQDSKGKEEGEGNLILRFVKSAEVDFSGSIFV